MKVRVTLEHKYNRLSFWFDDLNDAFELIDIGLREGYEVKVSQAVPENDPEVE